MNTCKGFISETGEPCPAPAGEDGFCLFHSEDRREEAAAARRLGGLHRRPAKASTESPGELNTLDDLRRWLNATLQDTWELDNSVRRSSALSGLLKLSTEVVGQSTLNREISELKELIHGLSESQKKV